MGYIVVYTCFLKYKAFEENCGDLSFNPEILPTIILRYNQGGAGLCISFSHLDKKCFKKA